MFSITMANLKLNFVTQHPNIVRSAVAGKFLKKIITHHLAARIVWAVDDQ
ncbi:MAG: hypothetical protein ACJAQ6_002132 [Arenicella sp.]|jgi:hypothetical protein